MSGDFNKPALTDTYSLFAQSVRDLCTDISKGLDGTGTANIPDGSIRWNSSNSYWEKKVTGSWNTLTSTYAINVSTANSAAAWTTARTITLTSDVTGVSGSWSGSGNISFATTLATVNSNVGSFGSTAAVPVITVNGKGLITSVSTAALGNVVTANTNSLALTSGASANQITLTLKQSGAPTPTNNGEIEWDNDSFVLRVGKGASETKTFTPDDIAATLANKTMSSTCTWNGGTIGVGFGGTGQTSFTSGGLIRGNGGGALSVASAADIVTAIGATAVQTANNVNGTAQITGYAVSAATIAYTTSAGGPQLGYGTGGGAAMCSFHRPGTFGVNFGLDTDNILKVGGWSMGGVAYPIIHSNNINSYAPTLTGTGASGSSWNISILGSSASCSGLAASATNATNLNGSGTITGTTTGVTQALDNNSTKLATTEYVDRFKKVQTSANTTTFTSSDSGKYIHATGGVTIPTSVMATDDVVGIYNTTAGNITLTSNLTTLYMAGTANTGNRTLAQKGMATIRFLSSTTAVISGVGLS